MPEQLPYLIRDAVLVYAACGAAVGSAFLLFGIERLDPAAAGAYAFRPLLMPGLVLLWPVIAVRWLRRESALRQER